MLQIHADERNGMSVSQLAVLVMYVYLARSVCSFVLYNYYAEFVAQVYQVLFLPEDRLLRWILRHLHRVLYQGLCVCISR